MGIDGYPFILFSEEVRCPIGFTWPEIRFPISRKIWKLSVFVHPVSSAPKPQVSDAISGENSEVEQTDAKKSVDDSDEK